MLKTLRKITAASFVAASLVSAGAATAAGNSPVLDRVLAKGELRVGMSGDQAPFNVINRSGNMIGLEVDVAQALADAMGVELKIVNKSFGELLPALEKGGLDLVMSGVAITPKRTQKVSFVGPYMLSGKSILTKSDVLARAQESEDFNTSDLKLAALAGSTSQEFIELNLPSAQLVKIKNYDEGVQMVIKGKVDAMVADMPICVLSVLRFPEEGLLTLEEPMTLEPIGAAIPMGDAQFHNLISNYLDAFESTGILAVLRHNWLEDGSWIATLP